MVGRNRSLYAMSVTLREEISKYLDIETNPRRREAKVSETKYTDEHARNTARYSRYIIAWVDKRIPGLMDADISEITRRDVKDIASAIVAERGNCRTSQQVFANLKTILRQAASDGLMLASPGTDVANVGYKETHKSAIPEDLLSWMIGQRHLFPSLEFWAYMTVATTTGMRRGEVIAISSARISKHMLTIDQQIKANSQTLSSPKGGLSRTIPLSRTAMAALEEIGPKENGFYFPLSRNWVTSQLGLLKAALKAADPERRAVWQMMTPHTLRRSANTNLLIHGISPSLIAEYLS